MLENADDFRQTCPRGDKSPQDRISARDLFARDPGAATRWRKRVTAKATPAKGGGR